MKLKRLFILTLLIAGVATHAYAQFGVPNLVKYDKRRFHFGFTLGYNLFDYRITSNRTWRSMTRCCSRTPAP